MRLPFAARVGLILLGIVVVVGIVCALAGWSKAPQYGLALIFGGVAALFVGALNGPAGPPLMVPTSPGPRAAELTAPSETADRQRGVRSQSGDLFTWLAAGALAIGIGILLRGL